MEQETQQVKPRRGRPSQGTNAKTITISVRVTPDELKKIKEMHQCANRVEQKTLSFSDFIRKQFFLKLW